MPQGIVSRQGTERDAVKGLSDGPVPPVEQSRDGVSTSNRSRRITRRAQDRGVRRRGHPLG